MIGSMPAGMNMPVWKLRCGRMSGRREKGDCFLLIKNLLEIISGYGPFPVGIIVGILIGKWAVTEQFKYMSREIESLRTRNDDLLKIVCAKEDRISILHDNQKEDKQ